MVFEFVAEINQPSDAIVSSIQAIAESLGFVFFLRVGPSRLAGFICYNVVFF